MTKRITGKIATILSDTYVAINIGREHGVTKGMKFNIVSDSIDIDDPVSHEKLGKVEYTKTRIVVTRVDEKYSIAKNDMKKPILNFPLMSTYTDTLPLGTEDRPSLDHNVRIGDRVWQAVETANEMNDEICDQA